MEKIPGLRIVGDASEENKQKIKEELGENFSNNLNAFSEKERDLLEKYEYPKSKEEIELINFANNEVNKLRESFGLEPYDVPVENFHIVPPNIFHKLLTADAEVAAAIYSKQAIIFDASERGNLLSFSNSSIHELLHLKAHATFEVEEKDDEITKTIYRSGVSSVSAQSNVNPHHHFYGLHEAIVSTQQKKMSSVILEHPLLLEEKKRMSTQKALGIIEYVSEKQKIPKDDIFWVEKDGKDYLDIAYRKNRETLSYVCNEILKEFPDKFSSQDEVFNRFLRAQFTGQLLPVARLVESVFGEGSFRTLGDMTIDKQSAILCLESLKKFRSRFLKNKKPD